MRMIRKYNHYFENREIDLEISAADTFCLERASNDPSTELAVTTDFRQER